jgi:hypothetical protein
MEGSVLKSLILGNSRVLVGLFQEILFSLVTRFWKSGEKHRHGDDTEYLFNSQLTLTL